MMTARFEKRDFKRIFLYLDILVMGIFAVSLVVLVRDAYVAGFYEQRVDTLYSLNFWAMLRDAVFVVGSLAWMFFRYFRTQVAAFQDPWS
ncbi:MAG: hypothetical protein QOE90_159 [Thermoplasmata archaeon]|jgi:hypothetical protein|nr:hypothetical protein [Thermoplasmata archaeon]